MRGPGIRPRKPACAFVAVIRHSIVRTSTDVATEGWMFKMVVIPILAEFKSHVIFILFYFDVTHVISKMEDNPLLIKEKTGKHQILTRK